MLKVGGWLSRGNSSKGTTRSLNALDEVNQIEDAMASVTHIMNDDVEAAEAHLSKGSSPFHLLGKGVVTFMRATLGFEQDIMREASQTLSDAENAAYEQQKRAHRNAHAYQSPIYPPGTEYAVCLAEAQLMSAIVGVLNESLTEAIKSFYKLRKAYLTLNSVMDSEQKFLKTKSTTGSAASSRPGSTRGTRSGSPITAKPPAPTSAPKEKANKIPGGFDDDEDDDFVDADETHSGVDTPAEYAGHLGVPADQGKEIRVDNKERESRIQSSSAPDLPHQETPEEGIPSAIDDFRKLSLTDTIQEGEDASMYGSHPVDVFIISGSNFCFGILSLIISLVPPAFSTLLKVVGFKGDREKGIQMLWQATKFHNIHGAMGGLVLFGYYNGIFGFCDIVPQSGEGSYPKARCRALLEEMRRRHPNSHLWQLEQGRMLATDKKLEEAVAFMEAHKDCPLRQLEALQWFERSLNTMYMHDYEGTSFAFQKCVELNNWSHGLYYYICATSYVELYRKNKTSNPTEAAKHKDKAVELFGKVAPNTGKKRFMSRPMPFDLFVVRKLQKWEERAKNWGCDMIDAIGVSPFEEIIYFWNGYKRMRVDHLEDSLKNLAWSESAENPYWAKEEGLDEKGILAMLRAAALRNMGRTAEAKEVLQKEIIAHDRTLFTGPLKDDWTAPCARYEMAANVWREADVDGRPQEHMKKLEECKTWLLECSSWGSYVLDARIGMKMTTAKATLRRYGLTL